MWFPVPGAEKTREAPEQETMKTAPSCYEVVTLFAGHSVIAGY